MAKKKRIFQNKNEKALNLDLIKGVKTSLTETTYKLEYWNRVEYYKMYDGLYGVWRGAILHREDGPAVHYFNGHDIYYIDGLKHRENDWAERLADGSRIWYYHGKVHNPNGPAIIDYSTTKQHPLLEFWLNGERYKEIKTTEEWIIKNIIE